MFPTYSQDTINNHNAFDDELTEELLDEVVVSAQRAPMLQSELMRVVQVISRQEIERSPAKDVVSLLEFARGVDIRRRGSFGMQADISIRGGTFDQTLILLNGINISDPQTGHHNLNLPVDLSIIERIEILQGHGARVYGPNAFSGAINIITKNPDNTFIRGMFEGGQFGYRSAGITGGFAKKNSGHFLSLNSKAADGYTENTDFKNTKLFYKSNVNINQGVLTLQSGYEQKAFGANSFYSPRFPNQFEETRTFFISLGYDTPSLLNLKPSVYWRRHYDRFELFRENPPKWYKTHNYHMTNIGGASLNWEYYSAVGKTSLGLDYRFEEIYSNVLGMDVEFPVKAYGYDNIFYTKYYFRNGLSLMAEQNYYHNNFSASGGFLTYFNRSLDEKVSVFPGLDIGWQFYEYFRLYSSLGRTLRLPTFTDLFYSGHTNIGNPELEPEKAISFEAGIKSISSIVDFEIGAFKRWGKNMIDWVMYENEEVWKSMNHTKVNLSGIEVNLKKHIPAGIWKNNQKTYVSINYTYMHADKDSGTMLSYYVMDYMKHKLGLNIFLPVLSMGGISFILSRQHREGTYFLFENGEFTNMVNFDPFWLADIKLFYDIKNVKLFGEITNVFNAQIVDIANVPMAGRWLIIGISYIKRKE